MSKAIQTDDWLLAAMQSGDESALAAIIDRYTAYAGAIVWNLVRGRLGEADAKEILSDTFYTLWRNRMSVRPGKLRGYLGRIARSRAVDALRKARRELSFDGLIGLGIAGPEEDAEQDEEYAALREALEDLPEPDYSIFVRYYYCYQKTAEIAEKMGLNVNTVQTKLRRGRAALRKVLVEGGCFIEKEDSGAS